MLLKKYSYWNLQCCAMFLPLVMAISCTQKVMTDKSYQDENDTSLHLDSTLVWNENRKLEWSDFKMQPPKDQTSIAVITNCGFTYSSNKIRPFGKVEFAVTNVFNKNRSWVRKDQITRLELLPHEQLHFDISQLYARKLRREFKQARFHYLNVRSKSDAIFKKVYAEYLQTQNDYENETLFSLDKNNQAAWMKKIQLQLRELDNYKF